MDTNFHEKSYSRHQQSYRVEAEQPAANYRNWFLSDNADFWRHRRKLQFIDPLLEKNKGKSWLCIGDGRFGTSSMYIDWKGGSATATDITGTLLKKSLEEQLIQRMDVQNAEAITYADDSFDYVFCKEAYHHFPRPFIGMYEMLRVSRNAVVLIEPRDIALSPLPLTWCRQLKNMVKRALKRPVYDLDYYNYEEVGNYVYSVAEREFEKLALGLNLPAVAFRTFDDVYFPGVEQERATSEFPLFRKIQRELKRLRLLRLIGLHSSNYLVVVVFKQQPDEELVRELEKNDYRVRKLPRNPHC